ncbi:hypothetical protein BWI15_07840 [Kribbella sp. ALI-6-A]|uniref:hypothetical protein n=1 Tax=Kribbella sp. ALI-6-A TaxID=1933817 RepID=UPI00097C34F3|nr:hypothetical protein [Kribbella sp. ALI-6-A]ONI75728.1 hypothetical protein BWI15_07840 [Kribbella sp. ALI-6-A]
MSQQSPYQPYPLPYQPYQPQPYQPQAPMGTLHLTIQGSVFTGTIVPPTVRLNGYKVPVKYGRNDIPVVAGPLHIDVHAQWMRTFGRASLDCTVHPNQAVPVFYALPYHQFASAGSIGHAKVDRNGLGVLLALIAAFTTATVLMILVFLIPALSALPR